MNVKRPAVRYYGGKWRIGKWIIDQFPAHSCYVEPFAGGASVLLQKAPAKHEVLNDINDDVINFFDVLRSQTGELIRQIQLTPYARQELRRAQFPADNPLEQARRFYIRSWQSFGSGTGSVKSATGWRFQIGAGDNSRANAVGSWNSTDHLWAVAERLKHVQIECDDAYSTIQRFDSSETLFYLDFPYVHTTRYKNSKYKGYTHEMTDADHRRFAELARQVQGHVIVSGYPSPLYTELYEGWTRSQCKTRNIIGSESIECLWISPSVRDVLQPMLQGMK
jgi:DNA adenine methylase